MVRISFIIGYGASILPHLSKVILEEAKEHQFEGIAVSNKSSIAYKEKIATSDAILIYSHELPEEVERAISNSNAKFIASLSEATDYLSKCPTGLMMKINTYFKVGGERNLRNLVHLLLNSLGYNLKVEEVEDVLMHGIYHPQLGSFSSLHEYLEKYPFSNRPLVGILFYRIYWLYGDLGPADALIESLEGEGLGVVPVFTSGYRDLLVEVKTPTREDSIREFFIVDSKPVIEALVNLTFFFLLDRDNLRQEFHQFKQVKGIALLNSLKVPVIQPGISFYKELGEWLTDPQGLDYLSQVYTVIMPEVDGLIEPVYIAGRKMDKDGVGRYEPYLEHAKYIARRVKKWVEVKRKNPSQRKVAIILINPPCKSLEASVAVGFGLDVPESVVRLLLKLKECGYDVGNYLPKDGKELISLIMSRKALSEFRWTSVEEIISKGGAVAFIDEETYLSWFDELPEDVKSKLISDWGHPSKVLSGKTSKELVGMVYDKKFVIPGVLLGNILIMPQPKFGCVGTACDGKVCKILHEPTITPPHQWLAAYRWITRIFKADFLVHFGTHGYLEFRPGKGIGLSPSCWPQITIDDVPHLYVYNVSNPMEGVIAKRRSYATILDHIYPPMAMAEVLDDIDFLLAQYSKAKQLGEYERAKVIYDDLIEKALKSNIPVEKGKDPEKVIEEIHRYVSAVRGTQIEMGLHIFGFPPHESTRLAEYAATVMAYDSHKSSSIRRALAEYLGLDYDSMKSNLSEVNKLGFTNSETINILHKIAVNVIKTLIDSGFTHLNVPDEVIVKIVNDELNRALKGGKNA